MSSFSAHRQQAGTNRAATLIWQVRGSNCQAFAWDADDPLQLPTLLFIDVVDLSRPLDPDLRWEIERDGVVLRGRL